MQINVIYSAPPVLFYSLMLIVWLISYYFYRSTKPPIPRSLRRFCMVLRGAVLTLILWLLFRPVIRITQYHREKPRLAVLIDGSASMTVSEEEHPRSFQITRFLGSLVFQKIQEKTSIELFSFSDQIYPISSNDSLSFHGSMTNLTQALDQVVGQEGRLPLRGILLLSDGAHNEGALPENRCDAWPVPIYAVGIGDSQEKPDVVLTQVKANEITYVDQSMPVRVSLRGPGFGDREVQLYLSKGNQRLQRKQIRIPKNGLETSVTLYWTPEVPGNERFKVWVEPLAGELTGKNNAREFYVRIHKQKKKVLILSGRPDPDLGFIKRVFQQDRNTELLVRTQQPGGQFYEGNLRISDIEKTDVAVLLYFPNSHTSKVSWQMLMDVFQYHPKPLLIIAGKSVDIAAVKKLPQTLPVHAFGNPDINWVLPRLTAHGMQHPVPLIDDASQSQSAWAQLPPISTSWPDASIMPGAKVLVEGIVETSAQHACPILVSRSFQNQKIMMILANQLYRWHMLMWQEDDPRNLLEQVILRSIRWLSTNESIRPVRLKLEERIYPAGIQAPVHAEVYDETLLPVDDANVQLTVTGPDTLNVSLKPEGSGQYQGRLSGLMPGEYQIVAEATLKGRFLGRDTTAFVITDFQPEFLQTQARPEVLERISKQSGGLFFTPDSMGALDDAIHFPMETLVALREIKPWQDFRFLIFIVFLLSLEWLIRRRKGMM
ncbi:hypothetical protein JW835_11115 [bacterium]|nr:hypothetical protein [bacterium]